MSRPVPPTIRQSLLLSLLALVGCSSVYYEGMELLGQEKRDILKSRVESSRREQAEAQEQFQTTYERFKSLTGVPGGELEARYEQLNEDYERSVSRADAVRSRIRSIEAVAGDLFEEWQAEIGLISNPRLRGNSEDKLRASKSRYQELIRAMKRSESRMDPVLGAFRDQVLYLKHNLNAQAIADLETTVVEIEDEVADLIRDLQSSIDQADAFLDTLDG